MPNRLLVLARWLLWVMLWGTAGAEVCQFVIHTQPEGALVYQEDASVGAAPSGLPVSAETRLPPGKVVGRTGQKLELDLQPEPARFWLLHGDCLPTSYLIGSKNCSTLNQSIVLKPRMREVVFQTMPSRAVLYLTQVRQARGENPAAPLPVPVHFPVPPGRVLGNSGEPILVEATLGDHDVLILHPLCRPHTVKLRQGFERGRPPLILSYRNLGCWLLGHPVLLFLGALLVGGVAYKVRQKLTAVQAQQLEVAALEEKARRVTDLVVPSELEDPFLGKRLDDYRILQALGEGGMARVYRAVPEQGLDENQAVAIKIMSSEMGKDPELRQRFEREKRVYESLHHPNIVKVMASGVFQNQLYLVMELVRGSTLRAYVFPDGLPLKKVLELLTPVFEAVHFANKKGIVHRDLKPENIMITDRGQIKVMDFGLARSSHFSRVTATGSVLGTPGYMAPEQIEGDLHVNSDQYSLGIMIYEMLTGQLPFFDENPVTIIMGHLIKPVPPLAEKKPELAKVAPVVERMLAKKPEERYRDLEHALTSLRYVT